MLREKAAANLAAVQGAAGIFFTLEKAPYLGKVRPFVHHVTNDTGGMARAHPLPGSGIRSPPAPPHPEAGRRLAMGESGSLDLMCMLVRTACDGPTITNGTFDDCL
jgi:hypothetical protein